MVSWIITAFMTLSGTGLGAFLGNFLAIKHEATQKVDEQAKRNERLTRMILLATEDNHEILDIAMVIIRDVNNKMRSSNLPLDPHTFWALNEVYLRIQHISESLYTDLLMTIEKESGWSDQALGKAEQSRYFIMRLRQKVGTLNAQWTRMDQTEEAFRTLWVAAKLADNVELVSLKLQDLTHAIAFQFPEVADEVKKMGRLAPSFPYFDPNKWDIVSPEDVEQP